MSRRDGKKAFGSGAVNLLDFIPILNINNNIKRQTRILEESRKNQIQNTTINNSTTNQNYNTSNYNTTEQNFWNQQTIDNSQNTNVTNEDTTIINIYQAPKEPQQQNLPYLPDQDYLIPISGGNQATTKLKLGDPILLSDQSSEDRNTFGKTVYNPFNSSHIQLLRKLPNNNIFDDEIVKAHQDSTKALLGKNRSNYDPDFEIPLEYQRTEYQGFLIYSETKGSANGNSALMCGVRTINGLAQKYRANSTIGILPPSNQLTKEIKEVEIQKEYKRLEFFSELQLTATDTRSLLGFKVLENFEDSLEERLIKVGKGLYEDQDDPLGKGNTIPKFVNFGEFLINLFGVMFFRSGLHRFPSFLPKLNIQNQSQNEKSRVLGKLSKGVRENQFNNIDSKTEKYFHIIDDLAEFNLANIQNLDSLMGKFPLEFNYQDEQGNTKRISVPNLAEAITEVLGIVLNTNKDTDNLLNIGTKSLIELGYNKQIINTIQDISQAIIDYLGFKYDTVTENVILPFNPDGKSLSEFLQETTKSTVTVENIDDETLEGNIKKLLFSASIVRASQGFTKNIVSGDAIKSQRAKEKTEQEKIWENFKTNIKSESTGYPSVKIKEKSNPQSNNNSSNNQ